MTLYTLIRDIETDNPRDKRMIERRVSPTISYIKTGKERIEHVYSSEEEASKDAELWNKRFEWANLVPAKLTRTGEIKYRTRKVGREVIQGLKRNPSYEESCKTTSALLAGLGGSLVLRAGLDQLLNKIDPNHPPKDLLMVAGILGFISLWSYVIGKGFEREASASQNNWEVDKNGSFNSIE